MKKCPTCHMIIDSEKECPFCQTSLVYEPDVHSDSEKIAFNRYFWIYLVKTTWFSIACTVFCIIKVIASKPNSSSPLLIGIITCCAVSVIVSMFQRHFTKTIQWKYSEEYARFKIVQWKYLLGIIAVLFAVFI